MLQHIVFQFQHFHGVISKINFHFMGEIVSNFYLNVVIIGKLSSLVHTAV